jgi:hypothetical protein
VEGWIVRDEYGLTFYLKYPRWEPQEKIWVVDKPEEEGSALSFVMLPDMQLDFALEMNAVKPARLLIASAG